MAKKITSWEARDGNLFTSERAADEHERLLTFKDWLESLRDGNSLDVDAVEFAVWLERNRNHILRFYDIPESYFTEVTESFTEEGPEGG